MGGRWDPEQYGRFGAERAQPVHDLLALVEPAAIRRAVDLGCGSGELTGHAVERLGIEHAVGIDSSEQMLAAAVPHAIPDRLRFELGDISAWTSDGDHDLVLANASLQWVGDHPATLARWAAALAPGGQIAVQIPANADHPSHTVAAELAATEPFSSAFGGEPPADPVVRNVLRPSEYATVLHELGFARQHVRLQVYPHVLADTGAIVEWVKGTTLTRIRSRLDDDMYNRFVEEYRAGLVAALGWQAPVFYPFCRILLWGRLPD